MRREDFIARSILRGLGWHEKNLPLLCYKLGLDVEASKTDKLLTTVSSVLDVVSGGLFGAMSPSRKFLLDFRNLPNSEAFWKDGEGEAAELCELAASLPGGMIVFSERTSDSKRKCVATVFLHKTDILPAWILEPTAILRASKGGIWVWLREGESLVRDMADAMNWSVPTLSD